MCIRDRLAAVRKVRDLADGGEFLHQYLVDLKPACGVDDDDVRSVAPRLLHRRFDELRCPGSPVDVDGNIDPLSERLELIDRGRPLEIRCDEEGASALALQVFRLSLIHISEPTRPY